MRTTESGPTAPDQGPAAPPTAIATPTRRETAIRLMGRYGTPGVALVLIAIFTVLDGQQFFSTSNLNTILVQATIGAVIALGLTWVLIVGEFDLSIGYTASLAGILVAMEYDGSPVRKAVVIVGVLAVGALIGIANGLVVTKLGVNALVGTLGVGSLAIGVNYLLTAGVPLVLPEGGQDLGDLYTGGIGEIQWPVFLLAAIIVLMLLLQNRTTLGLEFRAVGANRVAATLSGVRVDRVVITSFVLSGTLAAAGGILITSNVSSGQVTGGDAYLLPSFAACFLGAAALREAEFHVLGTVIGVLTLLIGTNGMAIAGVNTSFQFIFQGLLLIAAVGMSTAARRVAAGRRVGT
jgi:ribose transport system permease protein